MKALFQILSIGFPTKEKKLKDDMIFSWISWDQELGVYIQLSLYLDLQRPAKSKSSLFRKWHYV